MNQGSGIYLEARATPLQLRRRKDRNGAQRARTLRLVLESRTIPEGKNKKGVP